MGCEFQKGKNHRKTPIPNPLQNNDINQPDMNALNLSHWKDWHPMRRRVIKPPEKRKPAKDQR